MSVVAIDQGTTSTRAVVLDEGGARLVASVTHRQIYPQAGWVEHDPAELLAAIGACLEAAAEAGGIAAVGIDNQGESCLAWDAHTKEPVSPVIVWQDDRTAGVCAALEEAGCADLVAERAGLPLDPYFSASKLGWLVREVPEVRRLAEAGRLRLGTTDAFFRDRLTGRFETDASTASRTSLMALGNCEWDAELCALFGVPIEALPAIGPTVGELGRLRCGGREVPLTASVVDQQAALYGHGCRAAGDGKMTFGTGAFALAVAGEAVPPADAGALPTVAWRFAGERPVYALDGGVYCAAAAVNWARSLGLFGSFDEIGAFEAPPAIGRGLAFVPALTGLACPHWERAARGAWVGLGLDTGPRDMVQAVLEGVALRMAEVAAAIASVAPLSGPIPIDGGMTANPYFCQFLADVLKTPVAVAAVADVTALGCGAMAAEGAGLGALPASRTEGRVIAPRTMDGDPMRVFAAAREAVEHFSRV